MCRYVDVRVCLVAFYGSFTFHFNFKICFSLCVCACLVTVLIVFVAARRNKDI